MKINDNISALQTYTNLLRTNRKLEKSVNRLSSGYRINSVADDAAGLAVSYKLQNQIRGMDMAARNALDGISLIQTADGALGQINNMFKRIRELAIAAENEVTEPEDREKMDSEVSALMDEIRDTAYKTEFNTIKMLSGEAEAVTGGGFQGLKLQIGANKGMQIIINIPDIRNEVDKLELKHFDSKGDKLSLFYDDSEDNFDSDDLRDSKATRAIEFCDEAIAVISKIRGQLGAYENRLTYTEAGLQATSENTQAALSRIMDTDMALEMTYNMQYSVISQAAIAILGQANQRPQQILQLL